MKAKWIKNQATIQEEVQEAKQQLQQERESKTVVDNNKSRKASSGGSVLVDKMLEPLDALLQAWEARINNNQTLKQRWLTYPYPEVETKRLEMCKELIKMAQALIEPNAIRAPEQEVLIHKEREKQGFKESEQVNGPKPDTVLTLDHRVVPNTTDDAKSTELMLVPEVEEPWPHSLWETIRNRKDESVILQLAPILEINLDNEFYPGDIQSLYGDAGTEVSMESKPQSLKTLPSFIDEHEAKSEMRIVPSQIRAIPKMIDTKSLQEMLSTSVTCTITLSELLKIRPHLWIEMGKHLETKGVKIPLQTNPPMEEKKSGDQPKAHPVPINKEEFDRMYQEKIQNLPTRDTREYMDHKEDYKASYAVALKATESVFVRKWLEIAVIANPDNGSDFFCLCISFPSWGERGCKVTTSRVSEIATRHITKSSSATINQPKDAHSPSTAKGWLPRTAKGRPSTSKKRPRPVVSESSESLEEQFELLSRENAEESRGLQDIRRLLGSLSYTGQMDPNARLGGIRLMWADLHTHFKVDAGFGGVPLWNVFTDGIVQSVFTIAAEFLLDDGALVVACRAEHLFKGISEACEFQFCHIRTPFSTHAFAYLCHGLRFY
ncbi:hypothetical protein L7F22_014660 [Adiantum nelumboides]|nr:hypothetical protein [Adiantum nelumboides]